MAIARNDSAVGKQFSEHQNLDELMKEFEQDAMALGYENGPQPGGEDVGFEGYEGEDIGYEETEDHDNGLEEYQGHYDSDGYSEDDEEDGGFQAYEDWKERRDRPTIEENPSDVQLDVHGEDDIALRELIQSINQDAIDLGVEESAETGQAEQKDVQEEAEEDNAEGDPQPSSLGNGPAAASPFTFRPLPIRQPAYIPPVPPCQPAPGPAGQQPLPRFVPIAAQTFPTQNTFRVAIPPYAGPIPFTIPGPFQRRVPTQAVRTANPAPQTLPPVAPQQATHYRGPAKRIKSKARLASNLTPRLANGTIDFEVKTCLHEMKRVGSEFNFNGHHDGNQKCARVLKMLFVNKFPDAKISQQVLADRLQQIWYARKNRPGRREDPEWKRVVEMRDADEGLRSGLRGRIRGTGVS